MEIRPLELSSAREIHAWLELPFCLYRNTPQWVPPFRGDALFPFNRAANPFYAHSEATFFGAWDGEHLVGRIAVLDNARYNQHNQTRAAFFTQFEAIEDGTVAQGLFAAAMAWAHERGLTELRGPRGFGALDGIGLLVRGFEHLPAMGIPYNPPYYQQLIEAQGLSAFEDLNSGYMDRTMAIPEHLHEVAARVMARRGLRVLTFRRKAELRRLIPAFQQLYNRSLGLIPDNMPLTAEEIRALAERLLSIAEPRLLKLVFQGDELVGFTFAYPNIVTAIQKCRDRLWPLGWAQLLLARQQTPWVDLNGMGIAQEHQGMGGATVLFSALTKTLLDSRFQRAELVQIRAHNDKMQRELARLPINWAKLHRIFTRAL